MSDQGANERAQAAIAADLLAQGTTVHRLSAMLTFGAALAIPVLGLLWPRGWAMAVATLVVLLGIVELWIALRVSFDAHIFERLARGAGAGGFDAGAFDAAMRACRLIQADKAGRPVALRVRGAMVLAGKQFALLVAQLVILAGGGWILAGAGS
jgi:hypothetical protein